MVGDVVRTRDGEYRFEAGACDGRDYSLPAYLRGRISWPEGVLQEGEPLRVPVHRGAVRAVISRDGASSWRVEILDYYLISSPQMSHAERRV